MIVCEGADREVKYFSAIDTGVPRRINIIVESPDENKSSPEWVKDCAAHQEQTQRLDWKRGDELWLVLDVDTWEEKHLRELGLLCKEMAGNWNCAISNPCFEIWLLMHYTETIPEFKQGQKNSKQIKEYLHQTTITGYNADEAMKLIHSAIATAKALDQPPDYFFPAPNTTKVYQLIEALQQKL